MLKNFWYACEFSASITQQPKQIILFAQRIVLYRTPQGQIVALKDRCPHRGAALSLGWVEDGCIRCPYHGWKFQGDGSCLDIPANAPHTSIPMRAKVESYSVQEKYGFVWLFYGDLPPSERPPIPPLPEFEDKSWHRCFLDFQVNTHYTRVLENSIDISHLPIVHANSFGAGFKNNQQVADYDVQEVPGGISAKTLYKNYTKPKGLFSRFFGNQGTDVETRFTFYFPNITKVASGSGRIQIINYAVHVPVDENTTISKRILFRSFLPYAWMDNKFLNYYTKIYQEDSRVSESQLPKVVPDNLSAEVHVASDALQIAYRKLRQQYLAKGWGQAPHHSRYPSSERAQAAPTPLLN